MKFKEPEQMQDVEDPAEPTEENTRPESPVPNCGLKHALDGVGDGVGDGAGDGAGIGESIEHGDAPGLPQVGAMRTARSPEDRHERPRVVGTVTVGGQSIPVIEKKPGVLRTYEFVESLPPSTTASLPLQARIIVQGARLLVTEGKLAFTAKDLTDAAVRQGLVTRQLPERIIGYYLPELRRRGLVL